MHARNKAQVLGAAGGHYFRNSGTELFSVSTACGVAHVVALSQKKMKATENSEGRLANLGSDF